MIVALVVAAADNGVIGKDNGLPWRLPADLAHFKSTTMGHPIIMGRRTYESIGRPLPGRDNIVITSNSKFSPPGCITASSLDEALKAAADSEIAFIIGGESIFKESLPRAQQIYLTRVHADIDGDRFFSFDTSNWRLMSSQKHKKDEKNQYDYEFQFWRHR